MKLVIQNKYVDLSTVTHIEESDNSISLFVFGGKSMDFRKDKKEIVDFVPDLKPDYKFHIKEYPFPNMSEIEHLNYRIKIGGFDDDIYYYDKATIDRLLADCDKKWDDFKKHVIDTWNRTESSIKDIKILQP